MRRPFGGTATAKRRAGGAGNVQIAIVLYDGFDDLDAVGPHEVFGHATAGADLQVGRYTLGEQSLVESSHGLRLEPDGPLPAAPDLVLVPGGGWADGGGVRREVDRGALPDALARLHEEGVTVASVCTGGMLLAAAGITDGRPAVTHHDALGDLAATGAEVVDTRVVDDGDVLTAGGVTAGIDLALHIVEREFDAGLATEVADVMAYERQGTVHRP